MATFGGLSLDSFCAVKYCCFAIGIFFELVIVALIYDMGKRNDFLTWISSIAVLDVMAYGCFIITNYFFRSLLQSDEDDYYECQLNCRIQKLSKALGFVFLSCSVVISLIMTYSVYHLLRYTQILNIRKSRKGFVFCLIPLVLLIAFIVVSSTISSDTHKINLVYDVFIEIIYNAPIPIVLANFVLFFLSQNRAKKILFTNNQLSKSWTHPSHQTAMAVLVKRMKYFPIIQSALYAFFFFSIYFVDNFVSLTFHILSPFCSLAYLILFLVMQPFALDHLKKRLGLGGKLAPQSPALSMESSASKVDFSLSSAEVSMSRYESSLDVDLLDYDNMDDVDLAKLIGKSMDERESSGGL